MLPHQGFHSGLTHSKHNTHLVKWSRVIEAALPDLVDGTLGRCFVRTCRIAGNRQDCSTPYTNLSNVMKVSINMGKFVQYAPGVVSKTRQSRAVVHA